MPFADAHCRQRFISATGPLILAVPSNGFNILNVGSLVATTR